MPDSIISASSQEIESPRRQEEDEDEDQDSSVDSGSDSSKEESQIVELLDPAIISRPPPGKVIIGVQGSAHDVEGMKFLCALSCTTGPPGSEWMDQNPISFGIAPCWQYVFGRLKRGLPIVDKRDKDKDARTKIIPDDADEGEVKDLEAGLGAPSDSDDIKSLSSTTRWWKRRRNYQESSFGKIDSDLKDAFMSDDLDENSLAVLQAARGGDAVLLSLLVKELKSPLEKTLDDEGLTALHCAALRGHTQCFKVILNNEVQSKVRGVRGPWFASTSRGGLAAEYFFTCHPHLWFDYEDILRPDKKHWLDEHFEPRYLFFEAFRHQEQDVFDQLIDSLSSESGVTDKERLNQQNDSGRTLLELSLVTESSPMLSRLISLGATLPLGRPLRLTRYAFGPADSATKLEQLLENLVQFRSHRLELEGLTLTGQLARSVRGAIESSKGLINELSIVDCDLQDIDASSLPTLVLPLLGTHALTMIDFSGIKIGNSGFMDLFRGQGRTVRKLQLRACAIGTEGMEECAAQAAGVFGPFGEGKWTSLQHLDLRGNLLGNVTFSAIIDFLKLVWSSATEDLFKFELLIWGNRMKAARLKAMMRKTPAPFTERVHQGESFDGKTMYDVAGHSIDILAGEAEVTRACGLAEKARDSSGNINPEWIDAKPVFVSRAAFFPKYKMKGASQKSLIPTCGFCPEEMTSVSTTVTTPLLAGPKKLKPGEDLALRVPHGAQKMRMLAAERELPEQWSTAKVKSWHRARTWPSDTSPPKPWAPVEKFWVNDPTKPSTAETKQKAINNEVRKMLKVPDKGSEEEYDSYDEVQWPTDKEAQQTSLRELQRIAEKKMHDLEFAREAASKGQCPGDLTPVRPRTYQLHAVHAEPMKESKRRTDKDSDSESESFISSVDSVEMESTAAQEVIKQVMSLDDRMIPWQTTKGEKMRENCSPQEPWTGELSEPVWEVFPLNVVRDAEATAQTGQAREKEKEQELAEVTKKAKRKKKKTGAEADLRKESQPSEESMVTILFSEPPPPEAKTRGLGSLKQVEAMLDTSSTPWYALHFMLLIAGSCAATFWTVGLKMAAAIIEQNYDIAIPEIWVASYPPGVWAIRAWSLSMLSALIAAIPLLVGHHLWYKSTKPYYSAGGIGVTASARMQSLCSPVILVLTVAWAVAVPLLAIPVALAHTTLCVLDPSQPDCAEGTMHILRSHTFAFPRSAGYADMLHAALASSVAALALTEALILFRTLRGHFVVRTSSDEGLSTVRLTGGHGVIGRQVNGLYVQVRDREHQGQPVFRRAQASQWLYLSEDGWRLTHTGDIPRQVDVPVTDKLPPWLHHIRDPDNNSEVKVEFHNAEWRDSNLRRIEGHYKRGRGSSAREQSEFHQKRIAGARELEIPLSIVPDENFGRRAIAKASYPKDSEQWIKEVDAIAAMDKDVDKEALKAAMRGFDDEFYKTLDELKNVNASGQVKKNYNFLAPLAKFLDLVGKARLEGQNIEAVKNSREIKEARENIVQASEGDIKGIERLTKFGSDNLEVTLILYVVLLLSGRQVPREVDSTRPPGLCQWSLAETANNLDEDSDDEDLICQLKEMRGSSDRSKGCGSWLCPSWLCAEETSLTKLSKAAWQLDVAGASGQTAWWLMPDIKATYIPPSRWQPRVGDYLYNFHSAFGIQLIAKSAAVLTDVAFDLAVVSKFIAGGYYYFTAISLFLIIAPSVACWAFLFSNGMMEVSDLFLCLSQTAVVMETLQALRSGKVGQNMLWVAVAEACLESLSQTMFQTYCLLIGYGSGGSNQVLIGSVMWGMVNVALVVSMLDLYGRSYTSWGTSAFRWLARYCEVASRVSTLALFAFYFRPSAAGADMHKSKQRAIFILLAVDYVVFLALLLSRDKGRGFTNLFWAMIACLVAPPCFIESFRSLQPIYYTLRFLELVAMIVAGVISGHGISKLVENKEAYIFLHVAVISTGIWILLNGCVFLWQLPSYLFKFASKRIVKVRVWPLEDRCMGAIGDGDLLPVKALEIEYDNGTTRRLQEEKKPTRRSTTNARRRTRRRSSGMSSQDSQVAPLDSELEIAPSESSEEELDPENAVQLSLKRGEELVEVKRYKWRYKPKSQCRAGVLFTTSFGRTWGPRQLADSDDDEEE